VRYKFVILIIAIFLSLCSNVYTQNTSFENYLIPDFGYFSVPTTLELQSGIYKKFVDDVKASIGTIDYEIQNTKAVFQQKGLNEGEKTDTYARIIILTYINDDGDYLNLREDFSLTNAELKELDALFKSDIELSFANTDLELLGWYGTELVKLNEYLALKTSYLRQLNDNPPVYVEIYKVQNNDRLHEFVLSYRLNHKSRWQTLYDEVLESISIIEAQ
jgi:hypothetical protein